MTMDNIIDTHVHCWDLKRARYEWLDGDGTLLNRSYAFSEVQPFLGEAGISGALLVQAANNLDDTEWMLETARTYTEVLGVVGWLPLHDPETVGSLLEQRFLADAYFKGVRHLIHNEVDSRWLLREPVLESLRLLAAHGIPYDVVGVIPEHLETALEVAARIPGLRLMLDHLNQPPIADKVTFGRWGELMAEAARHGQVWCKVSGLGTAARKGDNWTAAEIEPYVAFVFERFGAERCVCGGDWPVSLLAGPYVRTWQVYREVIAKLLPAESQRLVCRDNAMEFYNLTTTP